MTREDPLRKRFSERARRQRPRHAPAAQRGIALLVAILLVALGTVIAATVAYENAMTTRRGAATYALDQALLVAQGAEALAAYGLRTIYQNDPKHTYAAQGWGKPIGPLEVVPGVMLEASLEDLQGRFNLNSLVDAHGNPDPVQVTAFTNLLAYVGLEPKWAGYIIDWIDVNDTPSIPDGAEDSVYMGLTPPYRTPNRYITSISELLALPGFGRDRYVALAPYVTALPLDAKVNICSASGKVLDAYLGHGDFGSDPDALAKNRATAPGCFPTLADFDAAFADPKLRSKIDPKIGETSSYFRLTSVVSIGSAEFSLYSLLYQERGSDAKVRAVLRSFTPD
ncbi:MAG TPA: type II secretion system minor pseudopilin GspK [Steroidobacteraceae bacterium]|nr:type II secretion system minor pseudopilin GspK [Steroidobacteraceae bacterium]